MKKEPRKLSIEAHLGCFGNFNPGDPICKRLCAVCLRCAIESDYKAQTELLEDLVRSGDHFQKLQ